MGCSRISVGSLAVLIFTSYMENMMATTQSSPTLQDETDKNIWTVPIILPTEQKSKDLDVNTIDFHVKKCQSEFNVTEIYKKMSESPNCTSLENKTTEIGPFSVGKQVVTYRDFLEYTQYRAIGNALPYVANVLGFITNPITIIIALKIQPQHTSEIYMFVLGCADLVTVTLRIAYILIQTYLETQTALVCKMAAYLTAVSQAYSNLILASWTIERFIAVMLPMRLAAWCSVRNTKITATVLLLFCMLMSIPYITDTNAINIWNGRTIVNACSFSVFMTAVWSHIESVYYIYLTIILIFICNIIILCRLNSVTKARISMASNQDIVDKKSKENRKMNILLLTISGTFILLHIPYAIVMVINYMYPDVTVLLIEDPHAFAKYLLYTSCGYAVTEFQNSINFFLYCISGTKFRSTLRKIFCKPSAVTKAGTFQAFGTRK